MTTMMRRQGKQAVAVLAAFALHFSLAPSFALSGSTFTSSSTVYVVNTFTADENWTVPYGVASIDALAVGGGGGGGTDGGDGGGGGELRQTTSYTVAAGNVMASTIGGGGSGAVWGGSGSTSGGITYLKKDGATVLQANGGAGGSGWTSAQNRAAGGSGGSGGTGSNGGAGGLNRWQQTEGIGGAGADGPTSTIATGSAVNYGGGGGGGACYSRTYATVSGAAGGAGGGGSGAGHTYNVGSPAGTAGTANTGGGGGSGSACDGGYTSGTDQRTRGGAGGTGVVVIRYILTAPSTPDLDTASDLGTSNSDNLTNDSTPTFTGTAIGGTSIQILVDGVASGNACTANTSTGVWSCTTATLTAGTKTITVRSSINGATKDSASSLSVTLDLTAPVVTPSAAISKAENITSIATVSCNETCVLSMTGGADSASVTFNTGTGALDFKVAPDYEAPNDVGANRTYAITITATDPSSNTTVVNYVVTITNASEASVVGTPTWSGNIYKGVSLSLTVSSNAPGKVRFFMDGKRISNCLAVATTGSYPNYSATCSWKPASVNRHTVSASLTPSDVSFSSSNSPTASVFILKRTTSR